MDQKFIAVPSKTMINTVNGWMKVKDVCAIQPELISMGDGNKIKRTTIKGTGFFTVDSEKILLNQKVVDGGHKPDYTTCERVFSFFRGEILNTSIKGCNLTLSKGKTKKPVDYYMIVTDGGAIMASQHWRKVPVQSQEVLTDSNSGQITDGLFEPLDILTGEVSENYGWDYDEWDLSEYEKINFHTGSVSLNTHMNQGGGNLMTGDKFTLFYDYFVIKSV